MAEDFDEQFEDLDEDENVEDFDEQFGEEEMEEAEDELGDIEDDQEDSSGDGFDKPVSEGETVEVSIEDLGSKGDGIARVEGFVIFVPGAEVGETYDVEVTSVGRKFAFADIV